MAFKNVLLVKPNARKGLGFALDVIPTGLEYIASSIRDVVDSVQIVDMQFEKQSFNQLMNKFSPDLVGITIFAVVTLLLSNIIVQKIISNF